MLEHTLEKLIELLDNHADILNSQHQRELSIKAKEDLLTLKHINFYAIDAEKQIESTAITIQHYLDEVQRMSEEISTQDAGITNNIDSLLRLLKNKQKKIAAIQQQIPKGMLDIKRALQIASSHPISDSATEESLLKLRFSLLQHFMRDLNKQYSDFIIAGGYYISVMQHITVLYWNKLKDYTGLLLTIHTDLNQSNQLTDEGRFILNCIEKAIIKLPSEEDINSGIKLSSYSSETLKEKLQLLYAIGFSPKRSIRTCQYLSAHQKQYFYMPHDNDKYHFDYDPAEDLAQTGGDCFGQSMMFIHALCQGKFKHFCPEPGLINFQLDQTRPLSFPKETLAEAKTDVFAGSPYQSLQWEDIKHVFFDDDLIKPNDICGLTLEMNSHTKSMRGFTAGHIAVFAKLDPALSPYKYIIFEKELGAFGLDDEDSLKHIIADVILPMYEGMSYSKIKLIKYGEATNATYDLLTSIKPFTDMLVKTPEKEKQNPTFFQPQATRAEAFILDSTISELRL